METFTYRMRDIGGATDTAQLSVASTAGDAPVAADVWLSPWPMAAMTTGSIESGSVALPSDTDVDQG